MVYVDAIQPVDNPDHDGDAWARPTTVLWMSDEAFAHGTAMERAAWTQASRRGKARQRVEDLHEEWEIPRSARWYENNNRETLRDEIWPAWLQHGAAVKRAGIKTTSDKPRWALESEFASLFDPALSGDELTAAIDAWTKSRMTPGAQLRRQTVSTRTTRRHAVSVALPSGDVRNLEPGDSSRILKGVIEDWAPLRLEEPEVVAISEPGDKVYTLDAAALAALGLTIDPTTLLPDALLADIGTDPVTFWAIEVAASDGVVDPARREQILTWAKDQRIPPENCEFLTAFLDRNSAPARRRLKDLAPGTFAWFLSEPTLELSWDEIPVNGASVTRLVP